MGIINNDVLTSEQKKYLEVLRSTDGSAIGYMDSRNMNNDLTSLTMIGTQVMDSATVLNENYINLLQNFAFTYPPRNPLTGQNWFNTSNNKQYIYNGSSWIQLDKDPNYNIYIFNEFNLQEKNTNEIILSNINIPLEVNNVTIYNSDNMELISFTIDTYNKRKIKLNSSVDNIIIVIYNLKDCIANNKINLTKHIITESTETQFDITDLSNKFNINSYTVILNDILLSTTDFKVENNILNINSNYIINPNDEIEIKKYGAGYQYNAKVIITNLTRTSKMTIPKIFKDINSYTIFDLDNNTNISSADIDDTHDSITLHFMDEKKIRIELNVRII